MEICRVKFTLLTKCDNAVRYIYINSRVRWVEGEMWGRVEPGIGEWVRSSYILYPFTQLPMPLSYPLPYLIQSRLSFLPHN